MQKKTCIWTVVHPFLSVDGLVVEVILLNLTGSTDVFGNFISDAVNYQFVDPELEALPNAQKLMIRMGPENSKKIKAALRKLKKQLSQ